VLIAAIWDVVIEPTAALLIEAMAAVDNLAKSTVSTAATCVADKAATELVVN
jgi:hypothetical protein